MKAFTQHLRFWSALTAGIALYFCLPDRWGFDERVLIGWNGAVILFLGMIYVWMGRKSAEEIQLRYQDEDPSGPLILIVVIAASLLSVLAIVEPLATLRHVAEPERAWRVALVAVTLVGSWLLVPTMFTSHYADLFYSAPQDARPLTFPQTPMPDFWDFAYFSFTIAAACQTADVSTTRTSIRRVVIVHEIIAFAFNVAIIGFAINITAGLLSS
jgi:uncharacterized membrane protein